MESEKKRLQGTCLANFVIYYANLGTNYAN